MFDDTKEWCKLLVPKMRSGISWILMRAVASLKIGTLMCYFCRKYIMFEPKKRTGVMCHNTIWRGTDLYFERWHEQISEFWNNTWKSQNLHFNGLFLTKVYNIWAEKVKRIYASLYQRSMETLKQMTCGFINAIRNLLNFTGALKNPKICTLKDFFVQGLCLT